MKRASMAVALYVLEAELERALLIRHNKRPWLAPDINATWNERIRREARGYIRAIRVLRAAEVER